MVSLATAAYVAGLLAGPGKAEVLGPEPARCTAGADRPAVYVRVSGFKNRAGTLRVQVYGGDPRDFLAKGKWLERVDLPVTGTGAMDVCVPLPSRGRYAIAVRHDADGNGKSGWNDGGGFSRNPRLSLFKLKPDYAAVAIDVGDGPLPLSVVLQYRRGLVIRPL